MTTQSLNKYRVTRRGRKLQTSDDQRTLIALPKDVPERTWAEIIQKEDNDLFIMDIREDIIEGAITIGYDNYMERQTALFAANCAAQAWLKLINWNFYRHDPGEDTTAYPPCFIPKRLESWIPDEVPDPSPKDTWGKQDLNVIEDTPDEPLQKWPSSSSLDIPIVEDIPEEYWFPGKVNVPEEFRRRTEPASTEESSTTASRMTPSSQDNICTESEVLQKITDYSTEDLSHEESAYSALKVTTPVEGSLQGAGDSVVDRLIPKRHRSEKSKVFSKASLGKSRHALPPLDVGDSVSRISAVCDCRLRSLRLDTQFEVSSEKVDSPPGEPVKRK